MDSIETNHILAFLGVAAVAGAIYWFTRSPEPTAKPVQKTVAPATKKAPVAHTTQYSMEEIAKHNKESDLWIIVGTNVYDLTDFVHDHPGEVEALVKRSGAGQDATCGFKGFQHPDSVEDQIRQYLIGQLKEYSAEEIQKHNKPDDCWIVLNNKVYNVTPFIGSHPGGNAILRNAGADSTEGFKKIGAHSKKPDSGNYSNADLEMAKYLIGQLKVNKTKAD